MTASAFKNLIIQQLSFEPTQDQRTAMDVFTSFIGEREGMPVMLFRGSAGTGKHTLR